MGILKSLAIGIIAIITAFALFLTANIVSSRVDTSMKQSDLQPFYTPPSPLEGKPGDLLRVGPLGTEVAGAQSLRILYLTELDNGDLVAASGMAFIPTAPSTGAPRPIVAWTHGTVGEGDSCAPSRTTDPTSQLTEFLPSMIQLGWALVATDYTGLGTPGVQAYLLKGQEVRDTVNSVRALQQIPDANVGSRYAVFGHSQGGHTALWTGHLSREFAPELDLLGVAAAAPAAELTQIMSKQWDTLIGWVVGAEVLRSWPLRYPDLAINEILTRPAQKNYDRLAQECINDAALEAGVRVKAFNENFFSLNPLENPGWSAALEEQTPPPLPTDMPLLLMQGTADEVVLPQPNAYLQKTWCEAGTNITALWMGGVGHQLAAAIGGPTAVTWLQQIFEGTVPVSSCGDSIPVLPRL
jgi:alpha-beta hydrolase superfamily lysophospholipase